jgi:hypothetical protein
MNFSKTLVVLLLAVIATVGCGSNSTKQAPTNPTTQASTTTNLLGLWAVTLDEVGFSPEVIEFTTSIQSGTPCNWAACLAASSPDLFCVSGCLSTPVRLVIYTNANPAPVGTTFQFQYVSSSGNLGLVWGGSGTITAPNTASGTFACESTSDCETDSGTFTATIN